MYEIDKKKKKEEAYILVLICYLLHFVSCSAYSKDINLKGTNLVQHFHPATLNFQKCMVHIIHLI
jgi:hypothetical protein